MLVRTQILFPKDELEEYKELAAQKSVSLSEFVRTELKKKILKKKKKSSGKAFLDAIKWARSNKIKGPSDLGSNDEYLYGKLAPDYPFKKKK